MKKIILAISGIFCLQLAFIALNLKDPSADQSFVRTDAEAIRALESTTIDSPFWANTERADLDDSAFEVGTIGQHEPTAEPRIIAVVSNPDRSITRRMPKPVRNTYVENAMAIKPVKVEYKTHQAVVFRPQPARVVLTEYPQASYASYDQKQFLASANVKAPKKKGFFAKAFPVIKKPYDWLKAVGSAIR